MKPKKNSKVLDMIEEDLHAIRKVKDVSLSIKKLSKIRFSKSK